MIGELEKELVEKKKYFTQKEFSEIISISQSSPGVIIINSAMIIGYRLGGVIASFFAALGAVLAPFIFIFLISIYFFDIRNSKIVSKILQGIRAASVGIILASAVSMLKKAHKEWKISFVFTLISFMLIAVFKVEIFVSLLISASLVYFISIFKKVDKLWLYYLGVFLK